MSIAIRLAAVAGLGLSAVAGQGLVAGVAAAQTPDEAALLARGAYLLDGIVACGNCHTPQGPEGPDPTRILAGGLPIEEPEFSVVTPNITPDPETGIGGWTVEQIVLAIREGLRPDGSLIGPPMPFPSYRDMSDEDALAIATYLVREVAPVRNETPPATYHFPLPPAWGPPVGSVTAPDRSDRLAYGAYLVTIGHCMECHTPMVEGQFDWSQTGRGGMSFPGPWGVSVARNITSHPEDGIGAWSDDEIIRAITQGISRDGTPLYPPMGFAYYANIERSDLEAIVAHLRTLTPLPAPE